MQIFYTSEIIYNSGWHTEPIQSQIKKSLMIIMMRSQRGIVFTAGGFFPVTISLLASVSTHNFYTQTVKLFVLNNMLIMLELILCLTGTEHGL